MKSKLFLSTFTLLFLFLLEGCSTGSDDGVGSFFIFVLVAIGIVIIYSIISVAIQNRNKRKRIQMIKIDEENSANFDRSLFIGDDRCKIYFDSKKRQIMIMRVMTEGIRREYVNDFDFPGKDLSIYSSPVFNIYDPISRRLLSGTYSDSNILYEITSIADKDKNRNVLVNNTIRPVFKELKTSHVVDSENVIVLIDECHGLVAITKSGKVKYIFNYINDSILPDKIGEKASVSIKCVGNYMFILDDFFKVLVIVTSYSYEIFNYSDIIDVTYEENGNQLYSKSMGRTIGGAIVGGILMGGAGAVVGGLSGTSRQNNEIKDMDIKILLRNTHSTSYILHFNETDAVLKTKKDTDRILYEKYLKDANKAKDIFSVIIDDAKMVADHAVYNEPQTINPKSHSIADELSKLVKLREDGILTDDEFRVQKEKLLS